MFVVTRFIGLPVLLIYRPEFAASAQLGFAAEAAELHKCSYYERIA